MRGRRDGRRRVVHHAPDLIQPALDGKGDQPIAGFLRDATFVPDTKDILPLLSEMQTSHDPDNKYLTRLSRREWLVDGRFSCDDAIELGWPLEESDEYETESSVDEPTTSGAGSANPHDGDE